MPKQDALPVLSIMPAERISGASIVPVTKNAAGVRAMRHLKTITKIKGTNMLFTIIAAAGTNGVIGNDGEIPWHEPADLAFFKRVTTGCPCIMGRKTFESLPGPLSKRLNVVLTEHPAEVDVSSENVVARSSTVRALAVAMNYAYQHDSPRVAIIGGGEIYREFLTIAHDVLLTTVRYEGEGDTFFPELPLDEWTLIEGATLSPNAKVERYQRRLEAQLPTILT